ncbi:SMI1/KNR4 family protein [Lentzea sp. NPDC003310]|uniref:SMI1/KNR4 family protein n=1 Tax=Lentzea sp. NPDC003310 TaxID=3154447 RepID=UPI0033A482A8
MRNDLKALCTLVAPPARPVLGERSWEWVQAELGTRLPADYVEFMETYGGGTFARCLNLWTPLDPQGLTHLAREATADALDMAAFLDEGPSLPMWPEPGGFLPFGENVEGDKLGWLTTGDPDRWPLVFLARYLEDDEQEPPLPSRSPARSSTGWAGGRCRR